MLSENEIKILEFLKRKGEAHVQEISESTGLPVSTVYSNIRLLESKGIVKIVSEESKKTFQLTAEGTLRLENGLPEDRLISILNGKEMSIKELKDLMGKDFDLALGWARRKSLIVLENDLVRPKVAQYASPELIGLREVSVGKVPSKETLDILIKRKLVEVKEEKKLCWLG